MAKKLPKWLRKLDAADREHLRASQNGNPTLAGVKRNLEGQRKDGIVCPECNRIARKLGLPEVEAPDKTDR